MNNFFFFSLIGACLNMCRCIKFYLSKLYTDFFLTCKIFFPRVNFKNKKLLCVLGMHRSGTSALMGLMNHSGLYIGEQAQLMPAAAENAKGFYEHNKIYELNEWLLAKNNSHWSDLSSLNSQLPSKRSMLVYAKAVQAELKKLFQNHDAIGVKDPRLCLLLPLWRRSFSFKKIVVVHVVRHPKEVALSLNKRDKISLSDGLALWEKHVISQFHAANLLDSIVVLHSNLMRQPIDEMKRISQFLQTSGVDAMVIDERCITEFISPELYNNKITQEDGLSPMQRELWDFCQRLSCC